MLSEGFLPQWWFFEPCMRWREDTLSLVTRLLRETLGHSWTLSNQEMLSLLRDWYCRDLTGWRQSYTTIRRLYSTSKWPRDRQDHRPLVPLMGSRHQLLLFCSSACPGCIWKRFFSRRDDMTKHFAIGDMITARIIAFDRTRDPMLTVQDRDLGKIPRGELLRISATRVPRLIGKRGFMIKQ